MSNLLEIDNRIRNIYLVQLSKVNYYEERKTSIIELIEGNYNLSFKIIEDLNSDLNEIENYLKFLQFFKFYFFESREIIDEYHNIIKTPCINSFFKKKTSLVENKKNKLLKEYEKLLIPYSKILDFIPKDNTIKEHLITCEFCNSKCYLDENVTICFNCSAEKIRMINVSTYNENNKNIIANKYIYDRKNQFRECINEYQGKEIIKIPQELLETITNALYSYRIVEKENVNWSVVKISQIFMILKNLGYTKYYDHCILIHYLITGQKPIDIEYLEEKLIKDFDLILFEYTKTFKNTDKKHFNTHYILYQLLKKHGHQIDESSVINLKSNERRLFSENICKIIFEKLGWSYSKII